MREMRRKDRLVTDFEKIKEVIKSCEILRLGLFDEESPMFPYVVPLNFGYEFVKEECCNFPEQIYLYIHGALEGRKAELIRKNKKCSFQMDCEHKMEFLYEHHDITERYKCIFGEAEIEEIADDEKEAYMTKLLARDEKMASFPWNRAALSRTMICKIKVLDLSCKINSGKKPD